MTSPASWYPLARSFKRRVVAHLGPTNSGKTHAALKALKAAPTGIYCGPLRLLACEIADRLSAEGVPCDLVTGQEMRIASGPRGERARHSACTIEMATVVTRGSAGSGRAAPPGSLLDVAVLDEIQMLGDRDRGWSWTRALLGLAAREVHVAGDPAVLPVLRKLVAECGDELEVVRYRRLSPLVIQSEALGSMAGVQAGDCVVAFSRRSLHGLRREVTRRTGREACMVYGGLPPEARRQQAALFNSPPDSAPVSATGSEGGGEAAFTGGASRAGPLGGCRSSDSEASEPRLGRRSRTAPHPHAPHPGSASGSSVSHGSGSGDSSEGTDWGAADLESLFQDPAAVPHPGSGSGFGPGSGSGSTSAAAQHASRVLCASDAIGMGLNLNIRRVVFTSLHKFDGKSIRPLQASEVRQIAGRAGRFSSAHPTGYVTTLHEEDLPLLHRALAERPKPIIQACLLPSAEDIASFAARQPDVPMAASLLTFAAAARLGPSYVYGNYGGMYSIACKLRHLEDRMSAEEMLIFCTAPADMEDPAVVSALLRFSERYCEEGLVPAAAIRPNSSSLLHTPRSEMELKRLEELHRVYDLYIWLCFRLPYAFNGSREAQEARALCGRLIEEGLDMLAAASAASFGRRHHRHHHQQ